MSAEKDKPKTENISDADLDGVQGGNENITQRSLNQLAGAVHKGKGGGGGGCGMLAQASFQPFKTEPGEEMPSDMTKQTEKK